MLFNFNRIKIYKKWNDNYINNIQYNIKPTPAPKNIKYSYNDWTNEAVI